MIETLVVTEPPPFYCPLESRPHPRALLVEQRAVEWLRTCGMCATDAEYQRAVGSRSVDFYGRFVPSAEDDRLLATALWVYWGFAFDDARCDEGALSTRPAEFNALAGRVQRALEAPSVRDTTERYVPPLQDIADRFRSLGTATQFSRFAAAQRAWLSGVSWQIGSRALGRMPSLDEYLAMRLLSSGGEPTFAMVELALGVEVPAAEMHRPAVRALTEMAIMVAALDNDRHSLHREIGEGQDINVYNVLAHDSDLSAQEAVTAATGLRDRVLTRFLVLHEQVSARASLELRTYLLGLCDGIRGNVEWALRVPRYRAPDAGPTGAERALPVCVDAPSDSTRGPVPAPSVAWWWDDLV
ncbi:hypothetical protein [Streptomyces sp. NPDC058374]|uniref:terpene synthase family protein n=1 Tax=Streptomyces sp. NPDC058374 TaxID=3346466 RepID=UPI0036562115